jgi:hypothetical protein
MVMLMAVLWRAWAGVVKIPQCDILAQSNSVFRRGCPSAQGLTDSLGVRRSCFAWPWQNDGIGRSS